MQAVPQPGEATRLAAARPASAGPSLGVLVAAAPYLLLAVAVHVALLFYLAGVRFPGLWLRRHAGMAGPAMACSAFMHVALVCGLAVWALEIPLPIQPELGVWLQAGEEAAEPGPDVEPPLQMTQAEGEVREAAASASAEQVATVGAEVLGAAGLDSTDPDGWLTTSRPGGARLGGGGLAGLDGADDGLGAFGQELGRELGKTQVAKKGKANFFGISASGNSFVFVVDKSGSMQGSRFRRARNELRRSIEALEERQSYFVIFYDVAAHPMPTPGLLAASTRNNRDTFRWLANVEPVGNTNPLPAVLQALMIKPDAIFLLTDGDFPKVMADHIVQFQAGGTPIHTIGFENAAGEAVLSNISKRTGGTYRFVK